VEIKFRRNNLWLDYKHAIFVDGVLTYRSARIMFSFLRKLKLWKITDEDAVIRMHQKAYSWNFKIIFPDDHILNVSSSRWWYTDFKCIVGPDLYEMIYHRNFYFSLFKNKQQVAAWTFIPDAADPALFDYKILADHDCDAELLIIFCLVTYNLPDGAEGNFIQSKKFDENWRPAM